MKNDKNFDLYEVWKYKIQKFSDSKKYYGTKNKVVMRASFNDSINGVIKGLMSYDGRIPAMPSGQCINVGNPVYSFKITIVTDKMKKAGNDIANFLINANIENEMFNTFDVKKYPKKYRNIIQLQINDEIDSVTAIYMAMEMEKITLEE